MKKTATLLLAAAILLGGAGQSSAVDFKVKGSWQFSFDYINGGNFMGKNRQGKHTIGQQWAAVRQQRDEFEAIQRVHLQLSAIASERLSGTVFFEIGEQRWGMATNDIGGALGADGTKAVKVKQAYLDWMIPNTSLKLRMGLQGVKLPGFAVDTPILQDDAAGITASWTFNPQVSLSGMWLRPYNDNYADSAVPARNNYLDNFDLFGLLVPVTLDGLKITPWGMGGALGPHALSPVTTAPRLGGSKSFTLANHNSSQPIDGLQIRDGLYPAAFSSGRGASSLLDSGYAGMFWGGLTGQWTMPDPFRLTWDFAYGSVNNGRGYLNRQGWYGMLVAEYALDWGLPGLYGWYFSGDDGDVNNGSERLPYLTTTNNLWNSLSTFGYRGNPIIGGAKGVLGTNPTGTWGVGARVKDVSFWEDIKHILRVHYFGGTNNTKMASYITGRHATDGQGRQIYRNNTDFNSFGTYLTTLDTGMEINLDTHWKAAENLLLTFELGYIHLWLDKDVWGKYENSPGDSLNVKDAWKTSLNFIYSF
ncbi:MAG: outer membrane homotrimeric porin [Desulfovibrio sp.]|jgi:hypothetical protein|nr:outer membrane homotrimeric porin [Desulfovibrio sp.]